MKEKYYFPFLMKKNESNQFIYTLNKLYDRLGDEVSKEMFMCRIMFSLTCDYKFVRKMLALTDYGKEFSELLDAYSNQGLYIYGAGNWGERIFNLYPDKKWIGYIDKFKGGKETLNNLPVMALDDIDPIANKSLIFISNKANSQKIKDELVERGFDGKLITTWIEWNRRAARDSYFDDSVFVEHKSLSEGFFLDVGCYNGCTSLDYLRWMQNDGLNIAAFEADARNYIRCKDKLADYENVKIFNIGLSDKQEELRFSGFGSSDSSFLGNEGEEFVKTDTIDHVLDGKRVSYIKMDIEGFEEKALRGASETISRQKPALAISLYHKRDDILTIPKLIMDLNSDYRFYLRHYILGSNETVLYAINE